MSMFPANYDRPRIAQVQRALNELTYGQQGFQELDPDGIFGPKSIARLKAYQQSRGDQQTGVYTGKTQTELEFFMNQRYLQESDIREIAARNGLEYAMVRAIIEVESRGAGTLASGRPKILFERHKFYQAIVRVRGRAKADALASAQPGIVNATAGGYGTVNSQWNRLELAMALSVDGDLVGAAIESTSWGLGQVMGFNYKLVGYTSAGAFMAAMFEGERKQAEAIIAYLLSDPAGVAAVRNRNFAAIAKFYNGPSYAINKYDTRIEAAYKRYA